jgi:hypothetical protein
MALMAPHLGFAKELKDIYGVTNLDAYFAGALYPDSRYVTETNRAVTHPNFFTFGQNLKSDFQRGWHSHLMCDLIQSRSFTEMFKESLGGNLEKWEMRTALKIMQDKIDANLHNTLDLIPTHYVYNPNRENTDRLKEFHGIFKTLYSTKLENKNYHDMWIALDVPLDKVDKVIENLNEIEKNPDFSNKISLIFKKMVEEAKNSFCVKESGFGARVAVTV